MVAASLALAAAITWSPSSSATMFCHVKHTADGFVALRDRPSRNAQLLGRIRPDDEVLIGLEEQGNWVKVTWWRGASRLEKGYHSAEGRGWVNVKLIDELCG
ncbi:MAG: hypothetical protein ACKVP5_08510 [Aestuariivirga sp.]